MTTKPVSTPSESARSVMDVPAVGAVDYGLTRSGTRQLRRQWKVADGRPRAVALLVHGISEHSGRYEHVGQHLAAAGFHTVAFDHRGHGHTEGPKVHVDSFSEFLDDVEDHLANARAVDLPTVLIGHSMGGLICAAYAVSERPQPDVMVLSGPALGANVPGWQKALAPRLSQLAPRMFVPSFDFDEAVLSRDESVQAAYLADPLIRSGATPRLGDEMFRAMEDTQEKRHQIRVPTLVLHGADDQLVPASASEPLADVAGVERHALPGLRHEIFNEPEGREILDQVVAFLDANLADQPSV